MGERKREREGVTFSLASLLMVIKAQTACANSDSFEILF
jgi:hypothetical protein